MKISYLINRVAKTSVPITWAEFINSHFIAIQVKITAIKKFISIKYIFTSDILHGHHIKAMYLGILINKFLKKPTVFTAHGSYLYLSEKNKKLFKYICEKGDRIIFVNKYLYEVIPDEIKDIIKNKYRIILNGIDLNLEYKTVDVYKKYNIASNDKIIFHPARFVEEKNHLNIIEAFKHIREEYKNVKLILAGDGLLREDIEKTIKDLDLENSIILLGLISRDEVYSFLEKIDLFIMPSISEGLNIAFLEAMVFKRKILVSNISQFTYPFEHYKLSPNDYNVYFANPDRIDDIYTQMTFSLSQKRKENFDMKYFGIESKMEEYINIYKELV